MQLPYIQSIDGVLNQLQTKWRSLLNPVLAIPVIQGLDLVNVELVTGVNTINHNLGRKQQGWIVTDIDGGASIYRSKPFNDKFLILTSDSNVTVSLRVY